MIYRFFLFFLQYYLLFEIIRRVLCEGLECVQDGPVSRAPADVPVQHVLDQSLGGIPAVRRGSQAENGNGKIFIKFILCDGFLKYFQILLRNSPRFLSSKIPTA